MARPGTILSVDARTKALARKFAAPFLRKGGRVITKITRGKTTARWNVHHRAAKRVSGFGSPAHIRALRELNRQRLAGKISAREWSERSKALDRRFARKGR